MTRPSNRRFAGRLGLLAAAAAAIALGAGTSSCRDRSTEGTDTVASETVADSGASSVSEAAAWAGLTPGDGVELVLANCISCHGPKQFLQQRADRDTWLGIIRWMQRDHGLWTFTPEVETGILDYLATHYGVPEQGGRRPALRDELLPPNPYAGQAKSDSGK